MAKRRRILHGSVALAIGVASGGGSAGCDPSGPFGVGAQPPDQGVGGPDGGADTGAVVPIE